MAEIRDIAEGIVENDRQACRLSKRVLAVEPPVLAVEEGTKLSSTESLRQLLATVEKIRDFLGRYARTAKFKRALNRKANAAEFTRLGAILTEGMQALQLEVAVDAWAKEDASDRLGELEHMMDMLERMESNRADNHAELVGSQAEIIAVLKVSMEVPCGVQPTLAPFLQRHTAVRFRFRLVSTFSARHGSGGTQCVGYDTRVQLPSILPTFVFSQDVHS